MTAAPRWPGAGPYSYQPVRLWMASGGTWTVPSAFLPTFMTGALTPMPGIRTLTGTDRASAVAWGSWLSLGGAVVTDAGVTVAPASAGVLPSRPNAATLTPPAHSTAAARAIPRARRHRGVCRWRARYNKV